MPTTTISDQLRNLSREEKLALFNAGVERTRDARARDVAYRPTDGSRVVRVRLSTGRTLAYRLSADDLLL